MNGRPTNKPTSAGAKLSPSSLKRLTSGEDESNGHADSDREDGSESGNCCDAMCSTKQDITTASTGANICLIAPVANRNNNKTEHAVVCLLGVAEGVVQRKVERKVERKVKGVVDERSREGGNVHLSRLHLPRPTTDFQSKRPFLLAPPSSCLVRCFMCWLVCLMCWLVSIESR